MVRKVATWRVKINDSMYLIAGWILNKHVFKNNKQQTPKEGTWVDFNKTEKMGTTQSNLDAGYDSNSVWTKIGY